jgi:hypothetical protein
VKELQGLSSSDDCHHLGSPVPRFAVTGAAWNIGVYATPPLYIYTDTWVDDYVGMTPEAVTIYRNNGRAPCDYNAQQWMNMHINGHSGSNQNYKVGYIGGGIRAAEVYSFRDTNYQYRNYP